MLKAEKYLKRIRETEIEIEQDLLSLQEMKESATSLKSIDLTKTKVQTSAPGDRIGNIISEYTVFEEKVNNHITELQRRKMNTIEMIRGLHNATFNQILFKMYIQGKNMKLCSIEMQRSYSYVKQQHKKALETFDKKYFVKAAEETEEPQ